MENVVEIVCDDIDEQGNGVNFSLESTDPLQEYGEYGVVGVEDTLYTNPTFYRMNSIVFAEPLKGASDEENLSKDSKDNDEIVIMDNLIVRKETGKNYKKYHFNIEDGSLKRCPQLNCQRSFPTKKLLIAHIRRVHCADRMKYMCEQCGRGFPELHLLRRHADVHSEETVECPVCGVKLSLRTSLAAHLRCHSNLRPHECGVCKKTFSRASSKATHVKFVHREGLLECNLCEKRFSSRKQWSLHMKTHRQKKPD